MHRLRGLGTDPRRGRDLDIAVGSHLALRFLAVGGLAHTFGARLRRTLLATFRALSPLLHRDRQRDRHRNDIAQKVEVLVLLCGFRWVSRMRTHIVVAHHFAFIHPGIDASLFDKLFDKKFLSQFIDIPLQY